MSSFRGKSGGLRLETLETRETPSRGFGGFVFPVIQTASGSVYADTNGNGVRDQGENGVNGVRVFADLNNNGVRDVGEPSALTRSSTEITFNADGVTTREVAGSYFFNAAVNRQRVTAPIRVEAPDGAALTTPVQSIRPVGSNPAIDIGLQGVVGTPDVVRTETLNLSSVGFDISSPNSSSSSGSSSSVYAVAYVSPNGQAFANVTGSVSGNGSVSGTSTAVGTNGTVTAFFGG